MSTVLSVIETALREINVLSEVDSASAEQGSYALNKLNQMMEVWKEDDIDNLGWFKQLSTAGTMPSPDWAEIAIITSLAVLCAPKYGATVSSELAVIQDAALSKVKRKAISEKLKNADMSHLPIGSGHYRNGRNILTDS